MHLSLASLTGVGPLGHRCKFKHLRWRKYGRFMANKLREIVGTLLLLKKNDLEASHLFTEHGRRKREGM